MKTATISTMKVVSSGASTGSRMVRATVSADVLGRASSTSTGACWRGRPPRVRPAGAAAAAVGAEARPRGAAWAAPNARSRNPRRGRGERLGALDLLLDGFGVARGVLRQPRGLAADQRAERANHRQRQQDAQR